MNKVLMLILPCSFFFTACTGPVSQPISTDGLISEGLGLFKVTVSPADAKITILSAEEGAPGPDQPDEGEAPSPDQPDEGETSQPTAPENDEGLLNPSSLTTQGKETVLWRKKAPGTYKIVVSSKDHQSEYSVATVKLGKISSIFVDLEPGEESAPPQASEDNEEEPVSDEGNNDDEPETSDGDTPDDNEEESDSGQPADEGSSD